MPSRRQLLSIAAAAGTTALAGCNAGVFEPRAVHPVSASATIPPGEHRAWTFTLARDRECRIELDEREGDARVTTLTPAQYEAYDANEPLPDTEREGVSTWLDDERYVTKSEITAGEWVLLCENVGAEPARVQVGVTAYVWALDLRT